MSKNDTMNRRSFLSTAGKTAAVFLGSGIGITKAYSGFDYLHKDFDAGSGAYKHQQFNPDIEIALKATPSNVSILQGEKTSALQYIGTVIKGNSKTLQNIEDSYLGPIIRARKGQKVRVRFLNNISEESIIHWHGLHVPSEMDGHPKDVIEHGQQLVYEFELNNRAGTYWYHPHPHGRTGPQVYKGLAGLFLVSDDEEENLSLPRDDHDIPLVIQDRTFDRNNQFVYDDNHNRTGMMSSDGFLGDRILVNGIPEFTLPVASRVYRLRLLNGSNSRIYRLAWEDGRPLIVIGTDGGLLRKARRRNYVMLGPGERIDLWADFSSYSVGSEISLLSLPIDSGRMGGGHMGRGGTPGNEIPMGSLFPVCKVKVIRSEKESLVLPETLSKINSYKPGNAYNFQNPRTFHLGMRHMAWTINGRTFSMEEVASDEVVRMNSLEAWEFVNGTGHGGMTRGSMMPHPMHIHGPQFQVIERRGVSHSGYVDSGWKDTVLLMPGERVKFLIKFTDYNGLFLYHCHNLEHEDMGMMRNYFVQP